VIHGRQISSSHGAGQRLAAAPHFHVQLYDAAMGAGIRNICRSGRRAAFLKDAGMLDSRSSEHSDPADGAFPNPRCSTCCATVGASGAAAPQYISDSNSTTTT